jgi:hypothetical protein
MLQAYSTRGALWCLAGCGPTRLDQGMPSASKRGVRESQASRRFAAAYREIRAEEGIPDRLGRRWRDNCSRADPERNLVDAQALLIGA